MNYEKVYNQIITRARSESREKGKGQYYEAHHIIPKSRGGQGKCRDWETHPNIVLLTAREHFVSHWLLCRIHPEDKKLAHAFWFMCKQDSATQKRELVISSRTYAEAVSNLKFTEEHISKISRAMLGNTNNSSRVYKGMVSTMSEQGRASVAAKRIQLQKGKTGLDAQAAKGPYTIEYQSGEKYTAGSYPELSKIVGISTATIQHRVTHKPGKFLKGWAAYKGE